MYMHLLLSAVLRRLRTGAVVVASACYRSAFPVPRIAQQQTRRRPLLPLYVNQWDRQTDGRPIVTYTLLCR